MRQAIMPQMPEPDLASIMFASCVLRPNYYHCYHYYYYYCY